MNSYSLGFYMTQEVRNISMIISLNFRETWSKDKCKTYVVYVFRDLRGAKKLKIDFFTKIVFLTI